MSVVACQKCTDFFTSTISEMVSHLVLVHQNDLALHITCDKPGCQSTFTRVFSYKSHLRPTHRDINIKKPVAQLTHGIEEVNRDGRVVYEDEEIVDTQNGDEMNNMKRAKVLYLLKLKEKNFLTQTSLDSVVQDTYN